MKSRETNSPRVLRLWVVFWLLLYSARAQAAESSMVEKAKAEGEVVLYTAWGLDTA